MKKKLRHGGFISFNKRLGQALTAEIFISRRAMNLRFEMQFQKNIANTKGHAMTNETLLEISATV